MNVYDRTIGVFVYHVILEEYIMNKIEFIIRLYLTGIMKSWTDRIDSTGQLTPQRFILNAMTELFDSLSEDDIELI